MDCQKKTTKYPFFKSYLRLLKSRCEIESKAGEAKKWEPLAIYKAYTIHRFFLIS